MSRANGRNLSVVILVLAYIGFPLWSNRSESFQSPGAQQLQEAVSHFESYRQQASPEETAAFADGLLAPFKFADFGVKDFEQLLPLLESSERLLNRSKPRLEELARNEKASGAVAASLLFQLSYSESGPDLQYTKLAIEHPALIAAVKQGDANVVYGSLGALSDEALADLAGPIIDAGRALEFELPSVVAPQMIAYFKTLIRLDDKVDEERLEHVREQVASLVKRAAERSAKAGEKEKAEFLADELAYVRSAQPSHLLQRRPAPQLAIQWSSDPAVASKSLDELEGKIILVDFFATWCVPCIRSFPKFRAIRNRYDEEDVVVVGVTSLQGTHYSKEGTVDTSDDPEREFELMKEFIDQWDVTWPVVFSERSVFNPDYGVVGLPHMAIIDGNGRLRHNAINPAVAGQEQIIEWIDALLVEAGKTPPAIESSSNRPRVKEMLKDFVVDFRLDPAHRSAESFVIQINGENSSKWTIKVDSGNVGKPVALVRGAPDREVLQFQCDLETLEALHEGQINALTAMAAATYDERTPLELSTTRRELEPAEFGEVLPLAFHFWTRGRPEVIQTGKQLSRISHGANMVLLYYQTGFRSAWLRMEPGQVVNETPDLQTDPFPSLLFVLEGTVSATIGGKNARLQPGQAALIPANTAHQFEAGNDEAAECLLFMFGKGA